MADALRQHIHAPDTLLAYVCGREVMARAMHQALSEAGVARSFDTRPPLGTLWAAYSGPHPGVEQCLTDARQRLAA
jgi:NAD(P)H-flavin reductase